MKTPLTEICPTCGERWSTHQVITEPGLDGQPVELRACVARLPRPRRARMVVKTRGGRRVYA